MKEIIRNKIDSILESIFIKNERRIITWGVCLWRAYWKLWFFYGILPLPWLPLDKGHYIVINFLISFYFSCLNLFMLVLFRILNISKKAVTDTTRIFVFTLLFEIIIPQNNLFAFDGIDQSGNWHVKLLTIYVQIDIIMRILERTKIFDMINKGLKCLKVKLEKCICNKHN